MGICDTTFCELKFKDVINICDGIRLGRIVDMVIEIKTGRIKGIILPGARSFNIFRQPEDIFIPWKNILRIGEDVILIEIIFEKNKKCPEKECDRNKDRDRDRDNESCESDSEQEEDSEFYDEKIRPKILKYLYSDIDIKRKKIV